jgi:predicted ester cyclase
MSTDSNKDLIRRYFNVWESGDKEALRHLVHPDYVGHTALGDRDLDGLDDRIESFRAALPGVVITVEAQIAEGDMVATRLSARTARAESAAVDTITTEAALLDAAGPTHLMGLHFARIDGGRLVEEWSAWESIELGGDPFDIEDSYLDK